MSILAVIHHKSNEGRNATIVRTEYGWELRLRENGELVNRLHPSSINEAERWSRQWLTFQEVGSV